MPPSGGDSPLGLEHLPYDPRHYSLAYVATSALLNVAPGGGTFFTASLRPGVRCSIMLLLQCSERRLRMKKAGWGLCALSAVLIYAAGCSTERGEEPLSKVFLRRVPKDLATEISDRIASLSKKSPLTPEAAKGVRDFVAGLDLKRLLRKYEDWAAIRKVGAPAIPTIAELLTSPDEELRPKALYALHCLTKPKVRDAEPGYEETESLLILLYRRSLLDRSVMVRRAAIAGLSGIGWSRRRSIPEGVKVGLEQAALSDPDRQNREMAQRFRQDLKLAPPNPDPNKRVIVN